MKWLIRALHIGARFWADQEGPTVTEYAVMLVLIILGVVVSVTLIGEFTKDAYVTLTDGLPVGS